MKKEHIEAKKVIGIWVRTSNHEEQGIQDIQALWGRFMSEGIPNRIPGVLNTTIYSIYTEYEGDYTEPYTTVLGCEVDSLEDIPVGMKGLEIGGGDYTKLTATGNVKEGAIGSKWMEIWQSDLDRKYTTDFEVYDERAQNPDDVVVDIFVAIN